MKKIAEIVFFLKKFGNFSKFSPSASLFANPEKGMCLIL
jgi:hypothetical protein